MTAKLALTLGLLFSLLVAVFPVAAQAEDVPLHFNGAYCNQYTGKCDLEFSFATSQGDLFWRYRLGDSWSERIQHNDDHFHIPVDWVSGTILTGEMQVLYKGTEYGSGAKKLHFSAVLP